MDVSEYKRIFFDIGLPCETHMNNNSAKLPDAIEYSWVDTLAPTWTQPYLRLSRVDRPIGTWLLLIPCWWGLCLGIMQSGNGISFYQIWIALGCGLGAILMRGAGCTWNDINDRKLDAQVQRTKMRPIPSGQITVVNAYFWMAFQGLLSFLILLTFPLASIILGFAALFPVLIYPFAKRFTWWPQVFLGIAFNWGILLGFSTQGIGVTLPCILFYIAAIFWTLFYDTIYAFQDIEDDSIIGIKSTARLFNTNAHTWLFRFILCFLVLSTISFFLSLFQISFGIFLFCLLGILTFCGSLYYQLMGLDINNPTKCLSLFRANKASGLILTAFLLISILVYY